MKFILKYFPIVLFYLIFSCQKSEDNSDYSSNYEALIEKANQKNTTNELDSAFYFFNQAKLTCSEQENEKKAYALYGMALIQNTNCDFVGLEETATEALSIYDNPGYTIVFNNFLGIAYNEQFDFENALIYYNKTYTLTTNKIDRLSIKNNIAVNYLNQKKYKKAIAILEPLLKTDSLVFHKKELAKISDNLGFAYFNIKNNSLAKKHLETGLKIRDSLADDYEKIASYMHLSRFYEENNPALAKEFAQNAYQFATNVNSPDDQLEALDLLIKNPTNKNTIATFEKFSLINDSINTVRQKAKNQFAKIKYDSKLALETSQKLKTERNFIIFILISFTLISILIFFLIRSKNKRKLQRTSYETETRISKKLHDELANDVFNVMTLAQSKNFTDSTKKEALVNQLETIYNRTRNISIENSEVETGFYFKENLFNLINSFNSEQINVMVKNPESIDWLKTKELTQITIYRVLQELLVNMKKHSQCSLALISFETRAKEYQINYSDNGIGLPKMLKFKNGLHNVETRIKNIKGSVTFDPETQKGFKVKIIFPK